MTDSSLQPISDGTGKVNSSDSSAQPHGTSEMNGSRKVANETHRGMKSRHLTMIAIGGTIGTGIFLSAGIAVSTGGPASALLSYCVLGIFVYGVVMSLGEMSSMYPVSGAFSTFGARFVSPALGFTLGSFFFVQVLGQQHMSLMPSYSLLSYLQQIPAFTQVLGCSWRWHEVDMLPVSLDSLTREVFLSLHYLCHLRFPA